MLTPELEWQRNKHGNEIMSDLDEALNTIRNISKKVREESIDDRKAVEMVISHLRKDVIFTFYHGACPEFDSLCDEDEEVWDLIEGAADILEEKL